MNIRFEYFGVRFHLGVNLTSRVLGVNSTLADGRNMVLWDFDDVSLEKIVTELQHVQYYHALPDIHILATGVTGYYHAYCFASRQFTEVSQILLETPSVDKVFKAFGIMRGYYTLRISKKRGREFVKVMTLPSIHDVECKAEDVATFSKYTTKRR